MLDFRKLFLTVVALALLASISMAGVQPATPMLNNNQEVTNQITQAANVGDVALTAGTTANVAQGLNTMDQCAMPDGVAVGGFRATEVTKSECSEARVSQAAQLTAHFDGEAATDVALGASTRSPSPPQMVLNHNTAKMVEVDVANPASNHRR